jgi:hypothetical protein
VLCGRCRPRGASTDCTAAQTRGPAAAREPKPQKHILTAYNRDNQMLMRRKKARAQLLSS